MMTEGEREKTKLAATYFNNLAVFLAGAGIVTVPLAASGLPSQAGFLTLTGVAVFFVLLSWAFRRLAFSIIKRLDD